MKEQKRECQNKIFIIKFKYIKILIYTLFITFSTSMLYGQSSMQWIYLSSGTTSGACTSSSDCDTNELCFGLSYTPNVTGTLTSYTTGFFVDCVPTGNPILSNNACLMTNNSGVIDACVSNGLVLLNCSGNSGFTSITTGVPVIIHQVCYKLSSNESIDIVEDEVTNLTVSIDLNGGGSTTEFPSYATFSMVYNTICAPLPVELSAFEVIKKEAEALLNWTTLSENNNDYFSIEWSTDGRNFEEIGQVEGAGTSTVEKNYSFEHKKPYSGINYYRLRQVDFDGEYEYSDIRYVKFELGNNVFTIYPNPANEQLIMRFPEELVKNKFDIQIIDITGRELLKLDGYWDGGIINVPLEKLLTGQYIIRLASKNKIYTKRFVKM